MFSAGNILYFQPFYFKNGAQHKNKFFVVLKEFDDKTILASLPTSKDYIPQESEIENGCIELIASCLNCFVFSPMETITECGKKFELRTYMYGHLIDEYELQYINNMYFNRQGSYIVWGKMKSVLFSKLIECFRQSQFVKRKYKRVL